MLLVYVVGAFVGRFLLGAVIGGLAAFIVSIVKKRVKFGIGALVVCGFAALLHGIAAIVAGIVFLLIAISFRPPIQVVSSDSWTCPRCGQKNKIDVAVCEKCYGTR